ncbi:AraC family transcriptional regulator [Alicyclobacillus fastidiosus]|uniref:AraC family transcriptional regulator n=1 Tax=Alicyclobacillus fastidiosus TaxID=392011 RepID=A0ABY6ZFS2_9BACL|nr:AraC family transcriptional regulator [Alicyclobacillus fastidiosus]WAH41764.1 AraC family transcriptional regulator [Alicyclobacillus fastidiosus]GMA63456.1 hypothetical protein GCM10025859_38960 [Alicyclobacillus fastidiosus]
MQRQESSSTRNSQRGNSVPFAFKILEENRFALDRLDLTFCWGGYGFRVLHCHLATFPPGKTVPLHKHSEYEFHFIPRGKGLVVLNDVTYPLHSGHFYLTGPDVLHYQEADGHESMDELCLHIDIQKIRDGAENAENAAWGADLEAQEAQACVQALNELPSIPVVDQYNAMQWFSVAYRAWHENQYGAYSIMKHAIVQILLCSVQNHTRDRGPFDLPHRDMNTYRYQLATRFVQDNYTHPITLEDVAERLHISPRQLQRIFAQHGGQKFREYVEDVRLNNVCEALVRDVGSVEEIAAESGFSSASYLHYVFKRRYGVTPTQFKEQALQFNHRPSQ